MSCVQTLADLVLEVRAQREECAALRESVDHLARRMLDPEDRRTGAALLPLILEIVGEDRFSAVELWTRTMNERSAVGQATRELIVEYSTPEGGGLRAFGRFLARLDGVALGGVRLIPAGSRREGRLWRVVRVSSAKNPQE